MKTLFWVGAAVIAVSSSGCGGGGDSQGTPASGTNSNATSTQFSAASFTTVQRTRVSASAANAKTDGATVSNGALTLDGVVYNLNTLADGTVIPNGLSQATDGSNISIECKGSSDAYVLIAQSAVGVASPLGSIADLANKKFQEYECIGGVAAKGGLLTFDATGATILSVVKNGATVRTNVPTSQVNPLIYKVGGKVFMVEYGVDAAIPFLIVAFPQ